MKNKLFRSLLVVAVLVVTIVPTAFAHPDQHGPNDGHLLGSGAFGNIDLVSKLELTQSPELIADVAISPDGQWAYLAHWGAPNGELPSPNPKTTCGPR